MGRPSGAKARRRRVAGALRIELERHIQEGQCAYCRTPARPDRPLTREHVIPRARGGHRRDVRIIVPACARCNQRRGCRALVPFLLAYPRRLPSFVDYLATLSPAGVRQLDVRVFAELYVAVAILWESAAAEADWSVEIKRLCSGRALHRRRHAARRALESIGDRVRRSGHPAIVAQGASCLLPTVIPPSGEVPVHLGEPLDQLAARLLTVLALVWDVPAELVAAELERELRGSAFTLERVGDEEEAVEGTHNSRRPRRKRLRVDRRRGGGGRSPQRGSAGRAA